MPTETIKYHHVPWLTDKLTVPLHLLSPTGSVITLRLIVIEGKYPDVMGEYIVFLRLSCWTYLSWIKVTVQSFFLEINAWDAWRGTVYYPRLLPSACFAPVIFIKRLFLVTSASIAHYWWSILWWTRDHSSARITWLVRYCSLALLSFHPVEDRKLYFKLHMAVGTAEREA